MRLSPAQRRLLVRAGDVQAHWSDRADFAIGYVPSDGHEQRTLRALIRKDAMAACGQLTDRGKQAWQRLIKRLSR